MKCNVLAICDDQIVYSDFLTKQLLRKEEETFRICRFSSLEQLITFNREHEIHCLVVSENYVQDIQEIPEIRAVYYLGLTMDEVKARIRLEMPSKRGTVQYIYRYQSSEKIYEILRTYLMEQIDDEQSSEKPIRERVTRLIGIYSPVHRNGQTTFAKAYANYYGGQGKKVLYLNMEEYAGITQKSSESEGDLGEVLYYLKQDIKSINYRLAAFTQREGAFEMVQPILMSRELRGISVEEWTAFLSEIKERSGYEMIILDLDSCVQGFLEILQLCDLIYMPIREGCGGEEKRKQFILNLRMLHMEELVDKIIQKRVLSLVGQSEVERAEEMEKQMRVMFR